MRTVTASYFMSLDGVVDAPQQWHFPYAGPELMAAVESATDGVDALLLGRRTFEEWRAFWPHQSGYPMAHFINDTPKYVATRSLTDLGWNRSTRLAGDATEAVADLKAQPGGRIAINGSGTLTRGLLGAGLVDELHLLVHPVVVGSGKHLFQDGTAPVQLTLSEQRAFSTGVLYLVYAVQAGSPGE